MLASITQNSSRWVWAAVLAAGLGVNLAVPAVGAQDASTTPAQGSSATSPPTPNPEAGRARALDAFDNFMQTHPDTAKEIQSNPSLLGNSQYLSQHPELQTFMNNHPNLAKAGASNPQRLMSVDQKFRQSGMAVDQTQTKSYDDFMHSHPQVAEQVKKDPSLANNAEFIQSHPQYEQYLKDHPDIKTDLQQHPEHFLNRAATYNEHHPAPHPAPATKPK
ncbi:MAG TPA: hypothetical protein VI455_16450 [Terriglobia bacterium]